MGKILEAFLNEQLCVDATIDKRSPKHQKLCDQAYELHLRLEGTLNDEGRELLEKLMDATSEENNCYAQSKFFRGYQLGVLMTMEVMADQDQFIYNSGN